MYINMQSGQSAMHHLILQPQPWTAAIAGQSLVASTAGWHVRCDELVKYGVLSFVSDDLQSTGKFCCCLYYLIRHQYFDQMLLLAHGPSHQKGTNSDSALDILHLWLQWLPAHALVLPQTSGAAQCPGVHLLPW